MNIKVIGGGPHDGHMIQAVRGATRILLPDCHLDQADERTPLYRMTIERDSSGKLVADWRKKVRE